MDKMQFLSKLDRNLKKLPFEERQNALRYYMEYFDDAGIENEQSILDELGNPQDVAAQIMANSALKGLENSSKTVRGSASTVWIVIISIFAAPTALPLALALVVIVLAVFIVLFALVVCGFAMLLGCIGMIIAGLVVVTQSVTTTLAFVGAGTVLGGIGILWTLLMIGLTKKTFSGMAKTYRNQIAKRALKNDRIQRGNMQ